MWYIARYYFPLFLGLLLFNFTFSPLCSANESIELDRIKQLENEIENLKGLAKERGERLSKLEPPSPVKIQDPPWQYPPFPSEVIEISDVIEKGTKIPFKTILDKPSYERPSYEEHWHSTVGRWSYIPKRVHYALHRLFTLYDIGLSNWYDVEHDIGLTIPMFQDEKALNLYIVAFQTEVTDVYTRGNQVVVVGNPKRNGVQVVTITTGDLHPTDQEEMLLVQLATHAGHEIDFSLISYVPPDYWLKQKKSFFPIHEPFPQA